MSATAFGMPLNVLRDGAVVKAKKGTRPLPLVETKISIDIRQGLAVTRFLRRFKNREKSPIEVIMTFPVGFHSTVTGLEAIVNGRVLRGKAQPLAKARETYEGAVERGELAVLHEEPLRGLNVLSIGPLPSKAEVDVVVEIVTPLSVHEGCPFLRLPLTIGHVYGDSPLMPADDILAEPSVSSTALLSVTADAGTPILIDGRAATTPAEIELSQAVELIVKDGAFGLVTGHAADGRNVELRLQPADDVSSSLDCAILVDHSGSTQDRFTGSDESIWLAIKHGLAAAFASLGPKDRVTLWQFDSRYEKLGSGRGPKSTTALLDKLAEPAGGTELIRAVQAAADAGARKILVITDGQTWATGLTKAMDANVCAVIVGQASLDVSIGRLAASTGGEVFYAAGKSTSPAILAALAALRRGSTRGEAKFEDGMIHDLCCVRSGVEIVAHWSGEARSAVSDAVGRFAAALALPLFANDELATSFATQHDITSHLTSLVLVDPETKSPLELPRTVKQPLTRRAILPYIDNGPAIVANMVDISGSHLSARKQEIGRRDYFSTSRPRADSDSEMVFVVNWAAHALDYRKGDYTALPVGLLELISAWAQLELVNFLAELLNENVKVVALALYVVKHKIPDTHAMRFAKHVLGRMPQAKLRPIVDGLKESGSTEHS